VALLVAIEGIDGTGKGTQARQLVDSLEQAGLRVRLISFPRYSETAFGRQIGAFLNGRFGRLDQVAPSLAALLYAGDRFESKGVLEEALVQSDVVVLDRYVPSNIAHQAGKLSGPERDALRGWIEQLEYEIYGLPRADRVILLDLPVNLAQQLISRKAKRDYTDKAADLQEADATYLSQVRSMYVELATTDPTWLVVEVSHGERIRPVSDIAVEVRRVVQADLQQRVGAPREP
jgi:dTMP kinase